MPTPISRRRRFRLNCQTSSKMNRLVLPCLSRNPQPPSAARCAVFTCGNVLPRGHKVQLAKNRVLTNNVPTLLLVKLPLTTAIHHSRAFTTRRSSRGPEDSGSVSDQQTELYRRSDGAKNIMGTHYAHHPWRAARYRKDNHCARTCPPARCSSCAYRFYRGGDFGFRGTQLTNQ